MNHTTSSPPTTAERRAPARVLAPQDEQRIRQAAIKRERKALLNESRLQRAIAVEMFQSGRA